MLTCHGSSFLVVACQVFTVTDIYIGYYTIVYGRSTNPPGSAKQSHPSKLQTFGSIVTIVPSEPIILDTTYDKIVMIRWFICGRNIRLSHIPIFICFLFSLRMNWHLLGSVESSAASLSWLSCIENGCSWPEREENSIERGMNQSSWPYTNSFWTNVCPQILVDKVHSQATPFECQTSGGRVWVGMEKQGSKKSWYHELSACYCQWELQTCNPHICNKSQIPDWNKPKNVMITRLYSHLSVYGWLSFSTNIYNKQA